MSKSNYLENKVLDHVLGGSDYTRAATVYLALSTADPGEAAGTIAEPSGNNYARLAVTNNATNFPAASSGSKSNGVDMTFATPSGTWGLVTHFAVFDASSGGNMLFYGALTVSKTINNTDTVLFPASSLTFTED